MIYTDWMSCIKDEVKLTSLVIPGAHNAGSYGMRGIAECQSDNLFVQFEHGIRQFCLRLNTDRKGNIVLAHGVTKGDLFENALKDIKKALDMYPSEIILLDVREYYPQKFGPITLTYKADKSKVDELLEKYISPRENAFCDFEYISEVTLGDIRKSGKRYILINDNDDYKTDGLYWFQTQQTPNLGTEIGVTSPKKLDDELVKYFDVMIDGIASTPRYLERANIIAGDFMTRSFDKSRSILRLNLLKGNVKDDCIEKYEKGLI